MAKKKKKSKNKDEEDGPKPLPKPPPGFTEDEWVLYNNPDLTELVQHLRGPCPQSTLAKFVISPVKAAEWLWDKILSRPKQRAETIAMMVSIGVIPQAIAALRTFPKDKKAVITGLVCSISSDLEAQDAIIASETVAPHPPTNSIELLLKVLRNTESTAVETSITTTIANITFGDRHRQRIINEMGKNGGYQTFMNVYATSVSATARAYAVEAMLFLLGPIKESFAHVPRVRRALIECEAVEAALLRLERGGRECSSSSANKDADRLMRASATLLSELMADDSAKQQALALGAVGLLAKTLAEGAHKMLGAAVWNDDRGLQASLLTKAAVAKAVFA
eukprot:CAMPEP_0118943148 /NCGR_PEP_ID=MMETSP1169-20130426/37639_1 /TAXON_ID=36882 /ORGANISM="Pyramimonas obovata, Strain CCMP722" /LENGTH=335 /DNA_ID=CAMNT_0006888321 /DNA_START=129 /DNA_END=1133 /DNA_ORIENTATION=+